MAFSPVEPSLRHVSLWIFLEQRKTGNNRLTCCLNLAVAVSREEKAPRRMKLYICTYNSFRSEETSISRTCQSLSLTLQFIVTTLYTGDLHLCSCLILPSVSFFTSKPLLLWRKEREKQEMSFRFQPQFEETACWQFTKVSFKWQTGCLTIICMRNDIPMCYRLMLIVAPTANSATSLQEAQDPQSPGTEAEEESSESKTSEGSSRVSIIAIEGKASAEDIAAKLKDLMNQDPGPSPEARSLWDEVWSCHKLNLNRFTSSAKKKNLHPNHHTWLIKKGCQHT